MKNKLLITLFFLVFPLALLATPPSPNLSILKKELTTYHDSGQYYADIAKTIKPAKDYLMKRIKSNPAHQKLAIVFDVDETLISGYQNMKKNDFGEPLPYLQYTLSHGNEEGIPATNELFQFAKAQGITIFLITGRSEKICKHTMSNLTYLGLSGWMQIYCKPETYKQKSIVPFKTAMRKKIIEQGYDIVLSIGDQNSDLEGGYADRTVKLPNPYYYVP